jgi:hypothetical protein
MVALLFVAVVVAGWPATDSRSELDLIHQSGKLFSVELTPANNELKVMTAGKPIATLGPNQVQVKAHVFSSSDTSGNNSQDVRVQPRGQSFFFQDVPRDFSNLRVDVLEPNTGKSESFDLNPKIGDQ